jgi:hypothetical protein
VARPRRHTTPPLTLTQSQPRNGVATLGDRSRAERPAVPHILSSSHREQMTASHRAYYASHREQKAAYHRAYYASHREQMTASHRAYAASHRQPRRGEVPVRCHACHTVLATLRLQDWDRYHPPAICPHCGVESQVPALVQVPVPRTNHEYLKEERVAP